MKKAGILGTLATAFGVSAMATTAQAGYLNAPPYPAPVIVYKDVGGLVTDYQAATEQYRRENREVRLHECRSACTLAISLPNVCVYPDAQVKFHQAYNAITKEVDLGISAELWNSYPAVVQARLGYLTREYKVLSGSELINLGFRKCGGSATPPERSKMPKAAVRYQPTSPQGNPFTQFGGGIGQWLHSLTR